MREKFELEYTLKSSPKILFPRLSTPEGLAEWFADNVTVDKDLFSFFWEKSESYARLSALKENKFVRFEWIDREEEESNYFEFALNIDEITGELALVITDFAEPDETEDAKNLWDTQILSLRQNLGV
jgi:uncharacterized protein YndB with AHSA1/START domain